MHVFDGAGERQRADRGEGSLALRENCQAQWSAMMFAQCTSRGYLFLPQQDEVSGYERRVARSRAGTCGMRRSVQFNHPHL